MALLELSDHAAWQMKQHPNHTIVLATPAIREDTLSSLRLLGAVLRGRSQSVAADAILFMCFVVEN